MQNVAYHIYVIDYSFITLNNTCIYMIFLPGKVGFTNMPFCIHNFKPDSNIYNYIKESSRSDSDILAKILL